jgi:hypothetical protein
MEASSLKFVTYDREESIGHVYYFTFFNFLFVFEYSHEISDIHSESLDDVINEMTGSKYDIIYLEDSNIWTSDREITLDAYRP